MNRNTTASALEALQGATTDEAIRHGLSSAAYLVRRNNLRAAALMLTKTPAPWDSEIIAAAADMVEAVTA